MCCAISLLNGCSLAIESQLTITVLNTILLYGAVDNLCFLKTIKRYEAQVVFTEMICPS